MASGNANTGNLGVLAGVPLPRSATATIRAARTGVQSANFGSVAAAIVPIPDGGPLDFVPLPVNFTQTFSDTIGDYGTDQDGWEPLLADMELSIGDDAAGVDDAISILGDLTDTDFTAFQANNFDPITSAIGDAATGGDTALGVFTNDIQSANNPPPPPPPPSAPPTGGGGAGGGGGTGSSGGGAPPGGAPPGEIWVWVPNPDGETGQWVLEEVPGGGGMHPPLQQ